MLVRLSGEAALRLGCVPGKAAGGAGGAGEREAVLV